MSAQHKTEKFLPWTANELVQHAVHHTDEWTQDPLFRAFGRPVDMTGLRHALEAQMEDACAYVLPPHEIGLDRGVFPVLLADLLIHALVYGQPLPVWARPWTLVFGRLPGVDEAGARHSVLDMTRSLVSRWSWRGQSVSEVFASHVAPPWALSARSLNRQTCTRLTHVLGREGAHTLAQLLARSVATVVEYPTVWLSDSQVQVVHNPEGDLQLTPEWGRAIYRLSR